MSATDPAWIPEDPERTVWDVVVVGAGMGGATAGYELARRGKRVLFLERGRFLQREPGAERGDLGDQSSDPDTRLRRGHWPLSIEGTVRVGDGINRLQAALSAGELDFFAPLGCGTGGSTILYGATLERFFPSDFRPREKFPDAPGATLPDAWPIGFEELAPYYEEAERLFHVQGSPDPLHPKNGDALTPPPALNDRDQDVFEFLTRKGLHPYRLHVGCSFQPGCDGCGGRLCLRACKSDAGWVCVVPAIERFGAKLMAECEVLRLHADASRVTSVECRWRGGTRSIRARTVVVASGALMTPVLLLSSRSEHWPDGLANRSGLVGRNLMVHCGDMIAVIPDRARPSLGFNKSLSFNDFYEHEGKKLGNVQSVGVAVDTGSVFGHLQQTLGKAPRWLRGWIPRLALRVAARVGAFYFRNAVVFGSIVEDLPYLENRVVPDPARKNGMRFEYRYTDDLARRNESLRRGLARRLGRTRVVTLTRPLNLNFGHPCGTCRFGDDPATSVLDADNRAHGVENLYVVDASFFPSSSGTNPSLTIAANALRVARRIAERMEHST